jgi:hypothetical protein
MPFTMRRIPITPAKLTGDVLEAWERRYLEGSDLAEWAEALLAAGFECGPILEALASHDVHWQRLPLLLSSICREIGLSEDVTGEIANLKREVMIEEYRYGHRQAAELLHRLDDFRKRIEFPEPVDFRLLEDNADGSNDSGYYGSESRKRGKELEDLARHFLQRAGIRA